MRIPSFQVANDNIKDYHNFAEHISLEIEVTLALITVILIVIFKNDHPETCMPYNMCIILEQLNLYTTHKPTRGGAWSLASYLAVSILPRRSSDCQDYKVHTYLQHLAALSSPSPPSDVQVVHTANIGRRAVTCVHRTGHGGDDVMRTAGQVDGADLSGRLNDDFGVKGEQVLGGHLQAALY